MQPRTGRRDARRKVEETSYLIWKTEVCAMSSAIQHGYSPPEPRVVDWLLSSLARRLYGAVDLGLLSCLELPPPEYARFTARHFIEPMRALALVVRLAVSEAEDSPP